VFSKNDERVRSSYAFDRGADETDRPTGGRTLRKLNLQRLAYTRMEADAIQSLFPSGEATMLTGFDANRASVSGGKLKSHRIVHFATYATTDSEQTLLSGMVMSLVDEQGNPQNGFLTLQDVNSLDFSAELVVLSASQTNISRNIRTAGFGLTQGFIYAGAKSTLGSLWRVDDRATAELMTHFYRALLEDGATPASALRTAKLQMWN